MTDTPSSFDTKESRLGQQSAALVARVFSTAGWRVTEPAKKTAFQPELIAKKGKIGYAIEIKAAPEGRTDRLLGLWSQACLQVMRRSGNHLPLAVVTAPRVSKATAERLLNFARENSPDVAIGILDLAGFRVFQGPGLQDLDSGESPPPPLEARLKGHSHDLFSDLNQWMLKVLLAPEIPDSLLAAPRGRYRNASELARAAGVSVMTAFRFVQRLQQDGYVDESSPHLSLVRRHDLFRRWRAAADRPVKEMRLRFVLQSDVRAEINRILEVGDACLALYAAADQLGLGFVQGVPPYIYVRRLTERKLTAWKNLRAASPGEAYNIIVRQAPSTESVFRGVVRSHRTPVTDVLQVWLDASNHPSRGQEQAQLIWDRVLEKVALTPGNDG